MVTETADLLNDPLLIFSSPSTSQDHNIHGLGRSNGISQRGISSSAGSTVAGTTGNATPAPLSSTSINSNGPNSNVTVEVNGSRFCIIPSLFRRVENLNWVPSSTTTAMATTTGRKGGSTIGSRNTVLKLNAKCHPDVFEMVLKFFLYNTVPDISTLSNRKANELIALAAPLDGAQPLVEHAQIALSLSAASAAATFGGAGGNNNTGCFVSSISNGIQNGPSEFLKRRLSSFSSLYSTKSTEDISKDNAASQNNDKNHSDTNQSSTANPNQGLTKSRNTGTYILTNPSPPPGELASALAPQSHIGGTQQHHSQVHQKTQIQSNVQSSFTMNPFSGSTTSDRSIDNRSIPSKVLLVKRTSAAANEVHHKTINIAPNSSATFHGIGVEGVVGASIHRTDSNNSTIEEDESISKLSQPSGANSDDPIENQRINGNNPFNATTPVPPSVTTFTPTKDSASQSFTTELYSNGRDTKSHKVHPPPTSHSNKHGSNNPSTEKVKNPFGRGGSHRKQREKGGQNNSKKTTDKESKKLGDETSQNIEGRPKLPMQQRRSTAKLFRSVLSGGSDRNVRRMSHAECCRTSEHIS